jgi:hypothetical protein
MSSFVKHKSIEKKEPLILQIRKRPFYYIIVFLLLINISLIAINAGIWIIAARQKLFVAADFTSFYTGYYMVRVGDGVNLYDMAAQARYQEQFIRGLTFEGGVLPFLNPPIVALILSPLSLVPLGTAFYLWTIVQVILLIWLLYSINLLFSNWNKQERLLLITTILSFWPLTNTFLLGQFSLLLLIGLLQMYIALKNSKYTQAGLLVDILIIKPQTLLIPGMIILNKRYLRAAAAAAIAGIFIFFIPILLLGVQPWIQFIRNLLTMSTSYGKLGVTPSSEYTLRGVLSNILGNSHIILTNIISIILLLMGMIYIWLLWRRGISQDSSKFKLYFAFTLLLSVVLSLHLNTHDSLILIVPAALFYDYLRENIYPRKAYSILILISPVIFFIAAFSSFNLFSLIRPPVVIILILLGWMIYYLVLDHQREQINQQTELSSTISS